MARAGKRSGRGGWWTLFRWIRIAVLLVVFTGVGGLIWLHQTGLPPALKRVLVEELRSHGVEIEFEDLRLRWAGGLTARRVLLSATGAGERLSLLEVVLNVRWRDLARGRAPVDSLELKGGRLDLPLGIRGAPARTLAVEEISARLRFLPDDRWELDELRATCLGATLRMAASLTNVTRVQEWTRAWNSNQPPRADPATAAWRVAARQVSDLMTNLHFSAAPELRVLVQGDLAQPNAVTARLNLHAARVQSRWGGARGLLLTVQSTPPAAADGTVSSEVRLEVAGLEAEGASVGSASVAGTVSASSTDGRPQGFNGTATLLQLRSPSFTTPELKLSGTSRRVPPDGDRWESHLEAAQFPAETPWAQGQVRRLRATVGHGWTGDGGIELAVDAWLGAIRTEWGGAGSLEVSGTIRRPPGPTAAPVEARAFWNRLAPYEGGWRLAATNLQSERLKLDELRCAGRWRAPSLELSQLEVMLYGGRASLVAGLDVDSRRVTGEGAFNFDAQRLQGLLGPGGRKWLSQYSWDRPPEVRGRAGLTLGAWGTRNWKWKEELEPTFELDGGFEVGAGGFRGVPISSARSSLMFSNRVWRLPDLRVTRPEGGLSLDYWCETVSQDYRWVVDSAIDPRVLGPLFGEGTQTALNYFEFTAPPRIAGTLYGRWQAPERIGGDAVVSMSGFQFRSETGSVFNAAVEFTNRVVQLRDVRFSRDGQEARVPSARLDLGTDLLSIENATSRMDPMIIGRMIGPQTAAAIEPYQFHAPPEAKVSGDIHIRDATKNDLRFHIEGGPFSYWKFNLPEVKADLHWRQDQLTISNLLARFYGGSMVAGFKFDFTPVEGAEFSFSTRVSEVDLHALALDLVSPTNRLEGILEAEGLVTRANSKDWKSWQGSGKAALRDGFLWSIPLFGMLSPALDTVMPGVGNSKASSGTATFVIRDSVIHTPDLEIHSPAMRLRYDGSVDFDGNVQAEVEAQVLRDAWLFGRLFSLAVMPLTKLLTYKVTGTLTKPKSELLHIPRFLTAPFRPFRLLRDLFPEEKKDPPSKPPAPTAPKP